MPNIIITVVFDTDTQETTTNIAATGGVEVALHDLVTALAVTLQRVAGQVRARDAVRKTVE